MIVHAASDCRTCYTVLVAVLGEHDSVADAAPSQPPPLLRSSIRVWRGKLTPRAHDKDDVDGSSGSGSGSGSGSDVTHTCHADGCRHFTAVGVADVQSLALLHVRWANDVVPDGSVLSDCAVELAWSGVAPDTWRYA